MKLVLNKEEYSYITREWLVNILNEANKLGKIGLIRLGVEQAQDVLKFKRSEVCNNPYASWLDSFELCGYTFKPMEKDGFEIVFL